MHSLPSAVVLILISVAALLLVGPTVAGQCVSEQEDNDFVRLADRLGEVPGSGCRVGAIVPSGDIDVYVFTVALSSHVVVETVTDGDTLLGLYAANGDLLAEDDDGGSGRASRIEGDLAPGTYIAIVVAYQDSTIGEYAITIEGDALGGTSCAREQESNDTMGLADELARIPGSGCRSGAISPSGDVDVYSIVVTQRSRVAIETITEGDTILRLYDANGDLLGEDDDGGDGSASRLAGTLSAGTYYAALTGYGGATIGMYEIRIDGEGEGGDSSSTTNPPPSDGAPTDGPPWGWSIVGDGIVFRAWGRIDKNCPSDYALGAGECDRDVYEVTLASGYVALGLIDERGQWITAHLCDAAGNRFLSKHGEAASIYSSWAAIGGGTYRVEVVPGKRLDVSSYELYVFYSSTARNSAQLVERYGPAEREL